MKVYNEAPMIDEAIRSIAPFVDDILVVDGAFQDFGSAPSDDGTKEKLQQLSKEYPIQLVASQVWQDELHGRNAYLEACKPDDWVVVFDADHRVEKLPSNLKEILESSIPNSYSISYVKAETNWQPVRWGDPKLFRYYDGMRYKWNVWTILDSQGRDLFRDPPYLSHETDWIFRHVRHLRSPEYKERWLKYWNTHPRRANGREVFTCHYCGMVYTISQGQQIRCSNCKSLVFSARINEKNCG